MNSIDSRTPAASTVHTTMDAALDRLGQLVGTTDKLCDRIGVGPRPATAGAQAPAPSSPTLGQKVSALHELLTYVEQNLTRIYDAIG